MNDEASAVEERTVTFMACPLCPVTWTLHPPVWLGDPWPQSAADRLLRGHFEIVHPASELPR